MAFRIAAKVIFNAARAVTATGRFRRGVFTAAKDVKLLKSEAKQANVSVNKMLRVMEQRKGVTKFQRDVKLANASVRNVVTAVKEARLWVRLFRSAAGRGVRMRGLTRMRTQFRGISVNIRSATASLSGFAGIIAGGLTVFGGVRLFGGFSNMVAQSLEFSNNMESARITFDVMLGSQEKSEDLMKRLSQFAANTSFLRTDIIEGSRELLSITGKDVDQNEKLVRLATEMAALTGGRRKVREAALGIRQAAFGEFDILKGFLVSLRGDQFKNAGVKGGEDFVTAVTAEIESQVVAKTGGIGRLTEAVSKTFLGRLSTLRDNIEQAMEVIGNALKKELNLADTLEVAIKRLQRFKDVLVFVFTGVVPKEGLGEINPSLLQFVKLLRRGIIILGEWKDTAIDVLGSIMERFQRLNLGMQKTIIIGTVVGGAIVASLGVVGPILTVLVLGFAAFFSMVSGSILPVLGSLGAALLFVLQFWPFMIIGVAALTVAFALFRRKNEGLLATMLRFGIIVKNVVLFVLRRLVVFSLALVRTVWPSLVAAADLLGDAFAELRKPFADFLFFFRGKSVDDIKDWADLGARIGRILVKGIAFGARMAARFIKFLAGAITATRPIWFPLASDIINVTKAIFGLVTGSRDAKTSLTTIFLGLVDILTTPLRLMLVKGLDVVRGGLLDIADFAGKFSSLLENKIRGIAAAVPRIQAEILTGFLATDLRIEVDIKGPELPIAVEIDGEKVGEATTLAEARARNSGRGGDPLNPEEMGFVLESGNRIRTVELNEVAAEQ